MKNIKIVLISIISLTSCGVYTEVDYVSADSIVKSADQVNHVTLKLEEKEYDFTIRTLIDFFYRDLELTVINKNNLDSLNDMQSEELKSWDKKMSYLVRRYVKDFESIAFSVPEKLIVCVTKRDVLNDLRVRPEIMFDYSDTYYLGYDSYVDFYDIDEKNKKVVDYWRLILRSVVEDRSHKCLLAIDYIPLKDSEYVLTLLYPVYGNVYYTTDEKGGLNPTETLIKGWDPIKEAGLSYQEIIYSADPISKGVSRANIESKPK